LFQDIKSQIKSSEIGEIISFAVFDGLAERVDKEVEKYLSSSALSFYGWIDGGAVVGVCGFEVRRDKVEIHLISVGKDRRRRGVGGAMVAALQKMYGLPVEAETDDDAVVFYRKLGFETTAFRHPKYGTTRYTCVL
jgi:ribosomal protein S18 acetylase RimI-like enzyme